MKSFTLSLGVVSLLLSCTANAQITTIASGNWNSSSTWSSGLVPNHLTDGALIIRHPVFIPTDVTLELDELTLEDTLIIEAGATVIIQNGIGADLQITTGALLVRGTLVCPDGATFSGTHQSNTRFEDDAVYEHRYSSAAGEPPLALWSERSTLLLTGYTTSRSLNAPAWSQTFGNVTYDCPNQERSSFLEMLGNIRDIRGSFRVKNTNGGVLRMSLDRQTPTTISIGGDFIIEGNAEVWMSRDANTTVRVGGDFVYRSVSTASSYITTSGTGSLQVSGDVHISSGILRFASEGGGTGTVQASGDFDFSGGRLAAVPPGNGTIELNGKSQTVNAAGVWEPAIQLSTNQQASIFLSVNQTITGDVVVKTGTTLHLPAGSFTLLGNFSAEPGANIEHHHGNLQLGGAREQIIDLQGDSVHHLSINKTGVAGVTLASSLHVSGGLRLLSATALDTQDNLTLLSTSDNGPDSYVASIPPGASINGRVTVQRFMPGEGRIYRYISSPVQGATVASLQDDFPITGSFSDPSTGAGIASRNASFFHYREPDQRWEAYPVNGMAGENPLETGRGYAAFIRQGILSTTWDVTGTLYQGDVSLPVTFTPGNASRWNLVGNPYASAIDWNAATGWTKVNVDGGIAVRDNGLKRFLYWDGDIGNLGNGRIAKGQAFWVQTNGADPNLIIHETAKTEQATAFYRTNSSAPDFIEIDITGTDVTDQTYFRLRPGASTGIDTLDVPKLDNDLFNLSILSGTTPLAISASGSMDCSSSIPLRIDFVRNSAGDFINPPQGDYTLSVKRSGLFLYAKIFVEDLFTHQSIDITEVPYNFNITQDTASYASSRFRIQQHAPPFSKAMNVRHPSFVCEQAVDIVLENPHEAYYRLTVNGQPATEGLITNSESYEFALSRDLFNRDSNVVIIEGKNSCHTQIDSVFVRSFEQPVVSEKDGMLFSNYDTGNAWYKEGVLVSDQPNYTPKTPGVYTLEVNRHECTGTAVHTFVYKGETLQCFPNPSEGTFTLVAPANETIQRIIIRNSAGIEIDSQLQPVQKSSEYNIDHLPPGIYHVEIFTARKKFSSRIVKK